MQEIFKTEALEPDNDWFESVPIHKEDEDVDMCRQAAAPVCA